MAGNKHPSITDMRQLEIAMCCNGDGNQHVDWYHFTSNDEAYFGSSKKRQCDIMLEEFVDGLERIDDDSIYPELPQNAHITTAPDKLDDGAVYVKRSGLRRYKVDEPDDCGAKQQMLMEALIMEEISKTPHPYIVRYYGCKVHRGRITGIALEKLGRTLDMCAYKMSVGDDDDNDESRTKFEDLDKEAFLAGVESAIKFLHSLGLAHNDISPANIMLREADDGSCMPVLIDFDSCAPFGERLMTFGTAGFSDEDDKEWGISHKKHDEFALQRLREWWDKDRTFETHPALFAVNQNRED
ncbi:kinase-like domain-containing protein [Chaetomium strumarium]|uniref:Kinase-like domain-containing protein n=1 Tax=Chaetomium strumarium TaxID=1170767 RepID=A0AAJ0M473_9PEZI|nr:kinase-like domain-containing protein [Chaetomium strumarium]